MKEEIKLSKPLFKILIPAAIALIVTATVILRSSLPWYWYLLITPVMLFLVSTTYFVFRVRLVFDDKNKTLSYYGYKTHIIDYAVIDFCQIEKTVFPETYYYVLIKKKNGDAVKISVNFVAFRRTRREPVIKNIMQD